MTRVDKVTRFVLKLIGYCMAVAAVLCVIVANWEAIVGCAHKIMMKIRKKCCPEYDYDDEEEESYFVD